MDTTLQEYFGFDRFRPGQREVIEHLLAGRSAAAVFPTGGGKSLCYQLPALKLAGLTLVVSPLIALMKDQIDQLSARGIEARRLDSTLGPEEYRATMAALRDGSLRLLYVAPERFNNEGFRETISRVRIALFAVDEAHCISEWGHNFRPDYLKLAEFARRCEAERVLALTATATDAVLADIRKVFDIAPECAVRTGFHRPNLTLLTSPVDERQRDALLLSRLAERPPGPTIIYVTLQRTAEELADRLVTAGHRASAYHAGLADAVRAAAQDRFMADAASIIVATIAFGMGIDKADIRYVYHYNLPKSLENYSQEIGRAGRDGQASICEMLVCTDDLNVLENFVLGDTPTRAAITSLLQALFAEETDFDVSLYELAQSHDIRPLVLRTLLTYLELAGYLQGGTPFYADYRFQPLASSADILGRFEGRRRQFLQQLFRCANKARTWFTIDLREAAIATDRDRESIVRALEYLAEQGLLEVRAAGVRHRYRRLQAPADIDALATELHDNALAREQRELDRLMQVLDLVALDGCQVAALAAHFGETLGANCGHCGWCNNHDSGQSIARRTDIEIDSRTWRKALALRDGQAELRADPVLFARLLCGISSPKLKRAKLARNPLFGALERVPFRHVLARSRAEASASTASG